MNLPGLWAEIEADQTWRQDEIRFFQNQANGITLSTQQDQFRRVLILLLYAHLEGFCKFALQHYINAINSEGIRCIDVNSALAAASLADLFRALRSPDSKCVEFRNVLPDDGKLHRFARDREFIERVDNFNNRTVLIPDDVIDTESNLTPTVLRKNLYRIGFAHNQFEAVESSIHQLLHLRNSIAHGEINTGIKEEKYNEMREAVFNIMETIKRDVMNALRDRKYLKNP